jgi:hypothetical protein
MKRDRDNVAARVQHPQQLVDGRQFLPLAIGLLLSEDHAFALHKNAEHGSHSAQGAVF